MGIKFLFFFLIFQKIFSLKEEYDYYTDSIPISRGYLALTETPILCPPESALITFKLLYDPNDSSKVKFGYNCYLSSLINYKGEYITYTKWTESDLNMDFLNKHNIKCNNNDILRGFSMEFNKFNDVDNIRFRINCYPVENSECLNDNLFATGWKKNEKSGLESLIEHKIESPCENCLISSFKIDMKYSLSENYEWTSNFNFGWCLLRENLPDI